MADERSFEGFVQTHGPALLRTAFVLTGSASAAEELLQDTLVLLYAKWDRVARSERPLAYVRRALSNRMLSQHRGPRSREYLCDAIPDQAQTGDHADTLATRQAIWQAMSVLPVKQRAAIALRYYDDFDDDEIAAVIGCRSVTVRSLISRGMATLRSASGNAILDAVAGGDSA